MAAIREIPSCLMGAVVVLICLPCLAQSGLDARESQPNSQNASISGTVQSDAGPLKSAHVSALQVVTSDGWARLTTRCSVETDSKGTYRCAGLVPGKYFVLASGGEPLEKQNKKKDAANPYAFFPSATDLEQAGQIVVGEGQLQSADIFVGSGDLYTVSCKINSRPRHAHPRLLAKTQGRDGTLVADTGIRGDYDEKHGQIRFEGVPQGSFEATVRWRAGRGFQLSEAEVQVQSANVAGISLDELRPAIVDGTVTVDSDSKVTLSTVVLERAFETDIPLWPASISAQIKGDGSFRFPSILPGRYFFKVVGDPQVFVESSSISGLSENGGVVVIGGGQEPTLLIHVSAQVGSIGGVVDDLPEGDAKAAVLVQSEDTGQIYTTTADKSGKFTVSGLGPGDYRIYSWPDLSHIAYRDQSVLSEYADRATNVILESGAMNQSVNVSLIESQ